MKKTTYHEETDIKNTMKLREVLSELPPFAGEYFRGIMASTSTKTRLSYAYDIRVFFRFLKERNPAYRDTPLNGFEIGILDLITAQDIEEFIEYLKVYRGADSSLVTNQERGLKRKMSALRSFYAYYFRHGLIKTNPTLMVDMPKIHEKAIVRLDADEVAMLLDHIEHCGDSLKGQSKIYYEKTRDRDLALVTLLLGTGIRVSELVGLDINDVDFRNNAIKVVRKGGNEAIVYFGEEVEKTLKNYLTLRKGQNALPGNEDALFLSSQKKRIGVRAVENLVEKYASHITTVKKITPHKLRSTYGTALYHETGDIYLVASVLGHKDVNTTKKHYAAMDEFSKRKAANAVKLRN